jgi:hypothetical protein
MRVKKISIIGIFLILTILTTVSAYTRFYVQPPTFVPYTGEVEPLLFDRSMCGAGQDFILQVSPSGCIPSVVRSDLLEDQNVPVFCPITATRLNPLIDIEAIYHMTFRGKYSPEVQGIHYFPARAALGRYGAQVNTPILNNIGYALIVLKQQKNESAMPNYVSGNLTAIMRYDIENAFGVGEANFYLPELTDDEWENTFTRYSFWDGRGYLRAESIEENSATISIYSDRETYGFGSSGEKRKLSSVTLGVGKKSPEIPMPGFDYCLGTMQIELNRLESPGTRVRLTVNGDVIEVKEKEKFLDNNCQVRDIEKKGIIQKVKIRCDEDEGRNTFSLIITPEINLSINGNIDSYGVGDRVPFSDDPNKFVYVGYISTKEATDKKEDLYVRFVQTPYRGDKLTTGMLSEVARFDNDDTDSKDTDIPRKIIGFVAGRIQDIGQWLERYAKYIWKGSEISSPLEYGKKKNVYGAEVSVLGFGEARDVELSGEFKDYYEKAMEDYENVIDGFSSEKYPQTDENKKTLGEQALFNQIELTKIAGQKKTTAELCEKFRKDYPNSVIPFICDEVHKLSSPESAVQDVEIEGRVERISFEGIEEPDDKEYGTKIIIDNAGECSGRWVLGKEEETCLSDSEFIKLIKVDEEYAEFDVSSVQESTGRELFWKTNYLRIKLDDSHVIGKNNYKITVSKIYLKKLAKVSVKPNIRHSETNASFGFKIGIEKRGIKLSPEKTAEKIESLNKTISTVKKINDGLGKIVTGFKWGCLGVGGALTVKNFFANFGGKGIPRNKVMRTPDVGWFERCQVAVDKGYKIGDKGPWTKVDSCLLDNNDAINAAVKAYSDAMETQDNDFEILQKGITEKSFLGEDVVNTDELMKRYLDSDYKNELRSNLAGKIETVRIGNKDVPVSDIIDATNPDNVLLTQARDLLLDSRLLSDENTREIAQARIESNLGGIWVNNEGEKERQDLESKYGLSSIIGSGRDLTKFSVTDIKTFGQTTRQFTGADIDSASPVIIYKDRADAKEYLLVLDGDSVIQQTYVISDNVLTLKGVKEGEETNPNPLGLAIEYFDKTTYENHYENAEIRYYETAPYKGLPAIVPFDVQNGWYAAIKSTLPLGKNIRAYDDSGRISSFWLCNVGQDGREEFNSGIGDDICEMINLGTGQPYNQFHGLEAGKASKLVGCAVKAIEQASHAHTSGVSRVKISTTCGGNINIKVGRPAVNIPDIQCQDFMSPSDCNLLFNVCDPVVCPNSRCDLGGTYPVKDVVQSGLAGSIALCLPNGIYFGGDVYVPVCLSGVHAGLEAYLSVLDSYQKCLQTSLETGQTVGICDEIYSIHLCEFFWRQGLPIVKIVIPKIIGMVLGQNVRGGGEYLGVQDAWQRASDSVNYFAQYYAANSFKAFKARTAEGVGKEVCKTFVSLTTPQTGNLFDALVAPDSPPQFYGRFDEIPFTTATSPPTSHYKVFYHIYAGKDLPAYFQVYLSGTGSSFFKDASFRRIVAQGFIKAGEYKTQTLDFTAPSGYQEMCIIVNGQEECGFKQVTTEFGLNYITEKYIQQQASQTDIKTEAACISGTISLYSLINLGLIGGAVTGVGGAADELVNPAIYNRGITRICATDNPGKGTDANWQTNKSRWRPVGYCGNEKIRCWLDTYNVEEIVKSTAIEEAILEDTAPDYLDFLNKEYGYVEDFDALVEEIEKENDMEKRIEKIDENYDKVFYPFEKGYLTLLRADAYKELALAAKSEKEEEPEYKVSEEEEEVLKITEELETALKSGTTSPVFEFKSGGVAGLGKKRLYYLYSGDYWHFSFKGEERAKAWFPIDENLQKYMQTIDPHGRLINPYEALSKEDKEFTIGFADKSYGEGLRLLIVRTIQNKGKGLLWSNVELSTDSVKLSHKGTFRVMQQEASDLYFEYDYEQKKWKWSPDTLNWMFVPETIVQGGRWDGKRPALANIDLIENLEEKNYFDGAKIIFSSGAQPTTPMAETCPSPNPTEEVLGLSKPRDRVLEAIEELNEKPACLPATASCHDSIEFVYTRAGVEPQCYYSDKSGQSYIVAGEKITLSDEEGSIFLVPRIGRTCEIPIGAFTTYEEKLDKIQTGDWLNIAWPKKDGGVSSHAAIFIDWVDEPNKKAHVFDWIGGGYRTYGYQDIYLTENTHPVYLYRNPTMA